MSPKAKFRLSVFVYSLICDIPVSFFLCLASAIIAQTDLEAGVMTISFATIDWMNFLTNFVIALTLSLLISNFIPLTAIGRWFTALFHVPNQTYTHNMQYRLLATLAISFVFFIIISPTLTVVNCFILPLVEGTEPLSWKQALLIFFINAPIMLLVGFVSSLINDIIAFKAAHAIDDSF